MPAPAPAAENEPTPDDLAPADASESRPSDSKEIAPVPVPYDPIAEILGHDGALARLQPNYEERPAQLEMAALVAKALQTKSHAVVEAGTGTGKTLAYLVPAIASGKKIVVATATKALQEQLVEKDLPLLQQFGKFKFAVMKGRSNYLCLYRQEVFESAPTFVSREEARQYAKLQTWSATTSTGDRAELDLPDAYVAWKDVSSTGDTCLGQECPRWDSCHVVKMKARAAEADIVVVNHHLFFADVSVRRSSAGRAGVEVIPRHDAVVFDEAHNMEEIATDFFGAALSNWRVFDLCRDIDRVATARDAWPRDAVFAATSALGKHAGEWFDAVSALAPADVREKLDSGPKFPAKPTEALAKPASPQDLFGPRLSGTPEPQATVDEILARARVVAEPAETAHARETKWTLENGAMSATRAPLADFRASILATRGVLTALEKSADDDAPPDAELQGFLRRLEDVSVSLDVLAADEVPGCVHWVEVRGKGVFVRASPVDVAGELSNALFTDDSPPVVMTSATLATGGNLDFFKHRIGLFDREDREVLGAILPSPFDYEHQAAMYLPRHLPEVSDPAWVDEAVREIAALIALAEGRTFVLFTSHRQMREVHARLGPRIPYPVLLQGQRPKGVLLREFRERPSVLFATQSFWEGVDIQGDALSMVIIDKLPFASPGDPLVAARLKAIEDRGGSSFGEYSMPAAAIALKQGFGRLIRSKKDTGCVAILDRRLWTKSYGSYFRRSLPKCPTFDRFPAIKDWWKNVRGHTGALTGNEFEPEPEF